MALRGSSPVNLNALRRDYSALPQIAAIKAQANQGIFNAIQSGLEKRKDNIEKAEKKELNIKLLNQIIESDKNNQFVPAGVTGEDLHKYVSIEETLKYAQAMGLANRAAAKEAQLIQAARNAAQKLGLPAGAAEANPRGVLEAAMKAQIESLKGTEPEYKVEQITKPDGTIKYVRVNVKDGTFTDITKQAATSKPSQVVLPGGLTASRITPKTGRPPVESAPSGDSLISSPSPAEKKAQQEALFDDVRQNIKGQTQTETGAFRVTPEIINRVAKDYKGILTEKQVAAIGADLTKEYNLRGRELIQRFSKDDPQFEEYLTALSKLPEDTKLQKDLFNIDSPMDLINPLSYSKAILNMIQDKQEFEAGRFDLGSIEKYNERIRRNPEIAQAAGISDRVYNLIKVERMSDKVQEKTKKTLPDGSTVYY